MTLEVSITCFDGRILVKDMIRDNRVMWLCKGCFREDWDGWLCKACFKGRTWIGDMIQANRVMWLCKGYFEVRGVVGCAEHVSMLG